MIGTNIEIKRVTRDQLTTLANISQKTFKNAFARQNSAENMQAYLDGHLSADSLGRELDNSNVEFYFAVEANVPIAYFKVNTGNAQTELKDDDHGLEIERIYVLQDHQGKKLGHRLLQHCIKLARQKGKTYVWLGVWEHNTGAIRFYQNNGFTIFDKHEFKVGNDVQIDWMMRLEL